MWFWRVIYTICWVLLLPVIVLRLLWLSRRNRRYRQRILERFGFVPTQKQGVIWLHAVSVGEVVTATLLIRAWQSQFPQMPIVITTTTATGSAEVERLLGDSVLHYYLPYDLTSFINRFIKRLNVRACIIMETELWPNLLLTLRQQRIPLFLANARLATRSARGYARLGKIMSTLLNCYHLIMTQSTQDKAAFLSLGADSARIQITGNVKYDLVYTTTELQQGQQLQSALQDRIVWVAASTHEGEEELILQAQQLLLKQYPQALLILVPRHPERAFAVTKMIAASKIRMQKRSEYEIPDPKCEVYLVDTLGELRMMYIASQMVFMGGSLTPIGGHNFLEAAVLKKPLLSGPYLHHFVPMSESLLAAGGLVIVEDVVSLTAQLTQWIEDPHQCSRVGAGAHSIIEQHKGAVKRHIDLVAACLPFIQQECAPAVEARS